MSSESQENRPVEVPPAETTATLPSLSELLKNLGKKGSRNSFIVLLLLVWAITNCLLMWRNAGFYGLLGPNNSGPKTTWPDLVGLTTEEAKIKIKEDMPGAHIQVVPPNSFVTMDFRQNRVRVYVDESGTVARAPRLG